MVQQELAKSAEMVWALLHSAQRDGQCFYPSQRDGDYVGAFSFCGLTAMLGKDGDVRLHAHDLDVILAQSQENREVAHAYAFDFADAHYNLAFYKGNPVFLQNWYTHIMELQGCFHGDEDAHKMAM
jgi:hypothetical protein